MSKSKKGKGVNTSKIKYFLFSWLVLSIISALVYSLVLTLWYYLHTKNVVVPEMMELMPSYTGEVPWNIYPIMFITSFYVTIIPGILTGLVVSATSTVIKFKKKKK